MGEAKRKREQAQDKLAACLGVQTPAGKVQVRWDGAGAVTPLGQLAYFIEFLHLTGLRARWRDSCPPHYTSPNAPDKTDVLGTWLLSILAGHRRYAHATAMRGDGVNPALPGMSKIISEDALRRALEERRQGYLFKLKLTKNVKRHIERLFRESDWADAGQGWEGKGQLKLTGWEAARRVVVLRRPLAGELLIAQQGCDGQQWLGFIEADRTAGKRITGYEYAVLVTNTAHEVLSLGQLYRDRADAENAFDELKNQWGWGGFTTHDLHRCRLSARAVALAYNWWSLFVRLAHPQREAITSRPWLMAAVGRATSHAGQTTITLCGLHAHVEQAKTALMQVSARLQAWAKGAAEQFRTQAVWRCVCGHLKQTLATIGSPLTCLKIGYDTA